MTLRLVTPVTTEPVSVEDLRGFARIDHTDDDNLLAGLGRAAREYTEAVTGSALAPQTWELTGRDWPSTVLGLPKPPLQAVVSVKHRTPAGALVTLEEGVDYLVDIAGSGLEPVTAWPIAGDYPDAVQVRFIAGYSAAPDAAKLAISALVAHWYEVRTPTEPADGATRRVPFHVKALLAQLRGGRVEAAT